MKNTFAKGMAAAVLHLAIILSLGGKLLYDRSHCPRVWVATEWVDPDLPIRGRYVTLRLRVQRLGSNPPNSALEDVRLAVKNNQLVAFKSEVPTGLSLSYWPGSVPPISSVLNEPVPFFIPEHAQTPFPPRAGEELWVEVTVPRKGRPRPIQLAVKRGTEWHPLNLR